jgi:hypothetical protein
MLRGLVEEEEVEFQVLRLAAAWDVSSMMPWLARVLVLDLVLELYASSLRWLELMGQEEGLLVQ